MEYDYDVALSLLGADEALATTLAAELKSSMSVFIYSERQKELAGTDGLETFSEAFGSRSRVCVVLYRAGWGKTPWTGVEETAIKNRGLERGWDFLLVVSVDGSAPIWLPKSQLWLGWERFGVLGAIAVIERKVSEAGGSPRVVTVLDHAEQVAARSKRKAEEQALLNSDHGVHAAHQALAELHQYLNDQVKSILSRAPSICLHLVQRDRSTVSVSSEGYSAVFAWSQSYSNTLRHAVLHVREMAGPHVFDVFEKEFVSLLIHEPLSP